MKEYILKIEYHKNQNKISVYSFRNRFCLTFEDISNKIVCKSKDFAIKIIDFMLNCIKVREEKVYDDFEFSFESGNIILSCLDKSKSVCFLESDKYEISKILQNIQILIINWFD